MLEEGKKNSAAITHARTAEARQATDPDQSSNDQMQRSDYFPSAEEMPPALMNK